MSVAQPVIPVISLPSAVLFPHALLELNLEGQQLPGSVGEWLAEGAIWGVATWRSTPDASWKSSVSVYRPVGIGQIVHRESADGMVRRLVLEGRFRGRVMGVCQAKVPEAVQVEILQDHVTVDGPHRKELSAAFGKLVRTARRVASSDPELRDAIRRVLSTHPHPGVVADLLAHYCIPDLYAKLCILDELNVCRRVQLTNIQLEQRVACHAPHQMRRPL